MTEGNLYVVENALFFKSIYNKSLFQDDKETNLMMDLGCMGPALTNPLSDTSEDILSSNKDMPPFTFDGIDRQALIHRLFRVKKLSGMSFSDIATYCGITNVYCAQLFHNQAQLRPRTARRLVQILPDLTREDIRAMSKVPLRIYDSMRPKEPQMESLHKAIMHNGNAMKCRYTYHHIHVHKGVRSGFGIRYGGVALFVMQNNFDGMLNGF